MKKTLLSLLLISTITLFAQDNSFSTGLVTFNSSLSAQIDIDGDTNTTTLTVNGPSSAWFAVGFGGATMSSGADVFRTDGTTIVDARTTSRSLPSADSQQDWTLVSNTVSGSTRTITATRANDTGDSNDFVFSAQSGSITMLWAYGSSTTYAYHGGNRGATVTGVVLGINEEKRLDFNLYPNPAKEDLTIQMPSNSDDIKVEVYDNVGRLALTQKLSQEKNNSIINIQDLTTGVYLIKIQTNDKIGIQRFIKK